MIIFMIIASPHYLSRVKEYSQLLLCEERNHITNVGQSGILELVMIRTSAFYVNFPYFFFFLQGLLKVYDYYEPDVVVDHKYKIKQTCGTKLAIPYFNQTGESYPVRVSSDLQLKPNSLVTSCFSIALLTIIASTSLPLPSHMELQA